MDYLPSANYHMFGSSFDHVFSSVNQHRCAKDTDTPQSNISDDMMWQSHRIRLLKGLFLIVKMDKKALKNRQ